MRKTYQYRARISKQTETNCFHWLELCRTLYNLALEQRKMAYNQQSKKSLSAYDQNNQLPELKEAYPEFKFVGSQVLQDVIDRVDKAFQGFFNCLKTRIGKAGFPRFKGRNRYDSFTLSQAGYKLQGNKLIIKKVGTFNLILHRPIEGTIKTITISRKPTGKWFVSFSCDNVMPKQFPITNREVGIDVGIKSFAVDSDGTKIDNPKYFRKSEQLLKRRSKQLSRKVKKSNNRKKAHLQVSKVHEKISNQRKDFLFKLANYYVQNYNLICVEDLHIQNMVKNKHLSKSISDAGWGTFFKLLSFKAVEAGRTVTKVNPNGTSQICSNPKCGEKVPKSLAVRIHNCPYCSLKLDRDFNSSITILSRGQYSIGSERSESTLRENVRP